jgi:ribosomal protein S2
MTRSQDIQLIIQLIDSMERASEAMEEAYTRKDAEQFKKAKEELLALQGKIKDLMG